MCICVHLFHFITNIDSTSTAFPKKLRKNKTTQRLILWVSKIENFVDVFPNLKGLFWCISEIKYFPPNVWNTLCEKKHQNWWLNQPIWKICSSNWIISPIRVENKTYLSYHHLATNFWGRKSINSEHLQRLINIQTPGSQDWWSQSHPYNRIEMVYPFLKTWRIIKFRIRGS